MTKILIVEDENIVAWDIKEALEKLGHTVVASVVSGAEAIQIAATARPDVVLMDIRLEGDMDGIAAAAEIYSRFDIPVIYLTAHADDHTLERATATNPFGYLVKPFRQRELHTTIQVALRRHQQEFESNAVKQQFATTLTSIGDATIATDCNGTVTFMNPVAEQITGWQQQEALGKDVNLVVDLVHASDREAIKNPAIQAMRLGYAVSLPEGSLLRTKDGLEKWVGDTAAPIKNNHGEIIGSVVVFKDITSRQKAQAELQQRNQTLEHFQLSLISQIQEQSAQLRSAIATQAGVPLTQARDHADLETLNRQLEALERTQSNLIAMVAHELRTPLSTICICLESLADEPNMPSALQQTMLEMGLGDAERLRLLIQDFLTLSRLESNSTRWQLESLSLQECLDLVLSNITAHGISKTLPKVVLDLPHHLPRLQTDFEGLIEVLTKLLDNACKFTDKSGQITIGVQVLGLEESVGHSATTQEKASMLEVIIADTGRGIEPSRLEAVFDRFYQEEGYLQRTAGGTGLGLAICRQLVQLMKGEIWATSTGKNQGSEFHFTVPIALAVESPSNLLVSER